MILISMKILHIKVKNCSNKIASGMQKMMILNYMKINPKHTNKQNVTYLKSLKTVLLQKHLHKIMLTLKVKFLRKNQNIKQYGGGPKMND